MTDLRSAVEAVTLAVHQAVIAAYGDTDCHCEQASVALAWLLRLRRIDARVVAAAVGADKHISRPELYLDHCWVIVDDLGLLCDPTIDQFRSRPVFCCAIADAVGYDPGNPANWHQPPPAHPEHFHQIETCSAWGTRERGWEPEQNAVFHAAVLALDRAYEMTTIRWWT